MFPPKNFMDHIMQIVTDFANLGVPGATDFRKIAVRFLHENFERGRRAMERAHAGFAEGAEHMHVAAQQFTNGLIDASNHVIGNTHKAVKGAMDGIMPIIGGYSSRRGTRS